VFVDEISERLCDLLGAHVAVGDGLLIVLLGEGRPDQPND
jgi:hypothetical protein